LSKILEGLAEKEKAPFNERKEKQDFGNKKREEKGYDFLAIKAAEKIAKQPQKSFVIDSIRNPYEADFFHRKFHNFYLFAIYAPRDERWKRIKEKAAYPGDFSQFLLDDERDEAEEYDWGQNVKRCVSFADVVVKNTKHWHTPHDEELYYARVGEYIKLIKKPYRPPNDEEANMNFAYDQSFRSSCLRRQVGAIIVTPDNKSLVSSGYNEVPLNSLSCERMYHACYRDYRKKDLLKEHITKTKAKHCPFCGKSLSLNSENKGTECSKCGEDLLKIFMPGKELDYCRSLHAEENAILENAFIGKGISLHGCILYATTFPCNLCSKLIVNSAIQKVVYVEPYPGKEARAVLDVGKVEIEEFEGIKARAYYKVFKNWSILKKN